MNLFLIYLKVKKMISKALVPSEHYDYEIGFNKRLKWIDFAEFQAHKKFYEDLEAQVRWQWNHGPIKNTTEDLEIINPINQYRPDKQYHSGMDPYDIKNSSSIKVLVFTGNLDELKQHPAYELLKEGQEEILEEWEEQMKESVRNSKKYHEAMEKLYPYFTSRPWLHTFKVAGNVDELIEESTDPNYLAAKAMMEELIKKGIPDYNLEAQSDKDANKKEI